MAEESETSKSPEKPGKSGKNGSFEEIFSQLEETVRKLEAGQLPLDQATGLFEEGMKLARRCNELLSSAELKVSRLQTAFAEQMRLVDDDAEDA
ncbi:MAG: exodeoxyribonuclease VII small subunit [Chloroflexi bacterium]|nr:exodeoxyribonuclease VII small subunit [Chloroflexota bacterium]